MPYYFQLSMFLSSHERRCMLREPITINRKLVEEVVSREEAEFRKRTPRSLEMHERAKSSLPMGVSSSFQAVPPYPLFISHAVGSSIWDIDGNRYADFHLAYLLPSISQIELPTA